MDEIMVGKSFFAYHWTSETSRIPGKIKKANEGREGQIKGQRLNSVIFSNFLVSLASFGVIALENAFG